MFRSGGYTNQGYHSDEDRLSSEQPERNRAISEVASMASRHRRRSVPSFASGLLGSHRDREGSVDPLLEVYFIQYYTVQSNFTKAEGHICKGPLQSPPLFCFHPPIHAHI